MRIPRELILAVPIPVIFTMGYVAFFYVFSAENRTLTNFVSFTSSLSTTLMVVIVIVTNSLQRHEMATTRLLQNQPLPLVTPTEGCELEKVKAFISPPVTKAGVANRMHFHFSAENIGNGPAIAVEVFPKLVYRDDGGRRAVLVATSRNIGSLKQTEKKSEEIIFTEAAKRRTFAECIMRSALLPAVPCKEPYSPSFIDLSIFYRNILGACFEQRAFFVILFKDEDEGRMKASLKLIEAVRLDYAEEISEINALMKTNTDNANKLAGKLSEELSKKEGCVNISFGAEQINEGFSVKHISDKEYEKKKKALQSEVAAYFETYAST